MLNNMLLTLIIPLVININYVGEVNMHLHVHKHIYTIRMKYEHVYMFVMGSGHRIM